MDIIAAKKAARQFVSDWTDRGDEKQDTQNYWNQLLRTVYGVEVPEQYIQYEKPVAKGFIDGYIADTKVLIEQKGLKIDLDVKEPRQGRMVTPYEQARDYVSQLAQQEKPDFIITCNFQTIRIYDCSVQPKYNRKTDTWYAPFEEIQLQELPEEYRRLGFLANVKDRNIKKEIEISIQAGELVGLIYDKLLSQYKDPDSEETQKSLNQLCVRLVFCLYAEDACVFSETSTTIFHDYLQEYRNDARTALIKLFRILDTETADRDPYENEDLLAFPYVNGGLFSSEEDIIIPRLTPEIIDLILEKASEGFDWSGISPTIFGAVFESTLNPETRRSGGMHYTSIENIHKVIDPLFLDDLKMEFEEIHNAGSEIKIRNAAKRFQNKLAGLRFLDPACGSGNFLTETYLSLRKLENETLKLILGDQIVLRMDEIDPIKVKIDQFYGIEINDFAVSVAKTAMWIAEAQTMEQTKEILHQDMDFLPLKNNVNIHEGNALRMDWNDVVPASELNYIMGNPPFVGYSFQSRKQKEEILTLYTDSNGKPYKTAGKIDYVTGWYWKSCEMMHNSNIHAALVSTNSITQGEQVSSVWKPLYERFGIHINFAYRTFRWDSEASMKAHVHCVVIGFSILEKEDKKLFSENKMEYAENINPYLVNADTIFIEKRSKPICQVPTLLNGGKPTEGGFLILTEDEKDELLDHEPQSEPFVRPYYDGERFHSAQTSLLFMDGRSRSGSVKELSECFKTNRTGSGIPTSEFKACYTEEGRNSNAV